MSILWQNPYKPADWDFLTAFCSVYSLFFPFTSHSKLETMRYWQWPQWHFLIFSCHSLSCYFKIILFSCHLLSHLNFSLFLFLVHLFFFFFFAGRGRAFMRDLTKYTVYEISFELKNFRLFCALPTPPWANHSGKQTRAHFILILNKGDFVVNFCYGRIYVPCLPLSPIEPIKILGICAFTIWRRGDGIWENLQNSCRSIMGQI